MKIDDNLIKQMIKGLIVFFIFFNSYIFQYIPINLFKIDTSMASGSLRVLLNAFSSIILVVIYFFMYKKELREEFIKFKKNFSDNLSVGFDCWFVGLLVMMVSNIVINLVFKGGVAANEQAVQEMINSLPWLMVINAGILAPINEEIVFRKTLKNVFKNKWVFMILSFILFGGAHIISNISSLVDLMFIIPYGALGAAFALAYYKTDSVFTPIAMHMFHNTTLVLFSIFI